MSEHATAVGITEALRKETGAKIGPWHYEAWLEGADNPMYEAFDNLVKKFIGEEAYKEMEGLARLDAYLRWRLGLGPDNAGGVQFKLPPTIGEYFDEHCTLGIDWDSPHLQGMRDCPLQNEPGVDSKAILDATNALIKACESITPVRLAELRELRDIVQERLEVIWCG